MFARLSILFLLFATGTATACVCRGPTHDALLTELEAHGFPANTDIFHGRVERWVSEQEVKVQVIEAFSGSRATKHLYGGTGTSCDASFSDREVIYFVRKAGVGPAPNVDSCSPVLWPSEETLYRLRAIAARSNSVDVVAREARRASDEKILRTHKGESLLARAEEASVDPQWKASMPFPQDKIPGVRVVHVNRLAIDAPVTVIALDGKEYRFVGKVRTTGWPRREKPVTETTYHAVTDSWQGHTASGDHAKIRREAWEISGEIYVGDRRFTLWTRGEFGYLNDISPAVIAENNKRRQEAIARQVAQRQIEPGLDRDRPSLRAEPSTVKPTGPPPQVLSDAQRCKDKTRFLSGLDEADGYPQPAHLRSYIAELRATVKAEMLQLKC